MEIKITQQAYIVIGASLRPVRLYLGSSRQPAKLTRKEYITSSLPHRRAILLLVRFVGGGGIETGA